MTWHPILRSRLATVLREVGPDAPTLCEGWRSRHLAAHLVLRQSAPVYGLGLVVGALAPRSEATLAALASGAEDDAGYASLVARVAAGPAPWSPLRLAGDRADLLELVVHTLDVTRAGHVQAPTPEPELAEATWAQLVQRAGLLLRAVPVGLVLVREDGPRARVHRPRPGTGTVVVRGALDDLVLYCFGRREAAHVRLEGTAADLILLADAPIRA